MLQQQQGLLFAAATAQRRDHGEKATRAHSNSTSIQTNASVNAANRRLAEERIMGRVYQAMPNLESVPATELHHWLGAIPVANDRSRFCVWAPAHRQMAVRLVDQNRIVPMRALSSGYHAVEIDGVSVGERYFYRLADQTDRPDPASRFQPDGVHGPSQIVRRDFAWTDTSWAGKVHQDFIIYELHIGTFTPAGTFLAAIDRLDELTDLGITAIELMPVAQAAGRWNWGYDGVCLFAPNHCYGSPAELKQLVDAAHGKGLAVILDVVYNHLGPEGNYLAEFGPYLSTTHLTPWGAAPNFDDPVVSQPLRNFFIANAIYWYDEFHFDALRIDAIHCMLDDSDPHIVSDIGATVKSWSATTGRPAILIAESNVYDAQMLAPRAVGGHGFDAQWCDDFLHSLFATVRPGESLSNRIYQPRLDLDQTLRYGYVYAGSLRHSRRREKLASPVDRSGLIYSIQNHDFIGNHPLGQRLHQLTSLETQAAAAALLILSPAIPMLFMGEEFAAENPFRFFVDFNDPRLHDAVIAGRHREYPQHDWSRGILPTDELAFRDSQIGSATAGNQPLRDWYRALIQLRKQWIASGLLCDQNLSVANDLANDLYCLCYRHQRLRATVTVRLTAMAGKTTEFAACIPGQIILNSRPGAAIMQPNHAIISISSDE
jgi:malto-oligosyltrehalose trehalohydrolase